jgi:DNA-binding response OmpR family regulator
MRILLVEDDEILIDILQKNLASQNYTIDAVTNGQQGWVYASTYTYDLIILDWCLPKVDGINLCQRFRADGYDMPILLLTTRNSSQDKTQALDAGADDYLCKPFALEELNARIRALLRRYNSNSFPVLTWGDLQLDPCSCQVTYQGNLLLLTNKEYQLLELFMRHSQEVFSIEEIMENLWSSVEYPSEATVRSHLRYLRQKLKQAGLTEDPIETLRGRGYCLKSCPQNDTFRENLLVFPTESQKEEQLEHLATLSHVWEKYQQKKVQQLKTLAETLKQLKKANLSQNQRKKAGLNAHKLAENLNLLGFEEASRLALQLGQLLQGDICPQTEKLLQFETIFHNLSWQLKTEDASSESISSRFRQHCPLVLVIDDDKQFTELFSQQAINEGIRAITTSSLESAQTWLEEMEQNQLPDIVVIQLAFNQWETNLLSQYLSLIAQLHEQIPSIPSIIIADRDQFSERLLVAQKGGTFYLKKPITPTEAISFCHLALKRSSQGKKIMIVDDDIEFLRVLPNLLEPWQFNITTLHDPRQFWDVLEAVEPDLLILGIEMPYFNGIELCQVVRNHRDWYRLPLLHLTCQTDVNIREQAFASGSDDVIHKPIDAKVLAERILHCFHKL